MNYLAPFTSSPGDFNTENTIDSHSVFMLDDAFKAVDSTPGGWDILARSDVPGSNGFMFSEFKDPLVRGTMEAIDKKLDSGHSGASYGWTMRNMESIAKKGWEVFMLNWRLSHLQSALENRSLTAIEQRNLSGIKFQLHQMILDAEARHKNRNAPVVNPVAILASATAAASVADPVSNPRAFFAALASDPVARSIIPDMDEQMDGVNRYFNAVEKAKKDPATWRQSAGFPYPCTCHRAQGKEGWCGVAGFGVPGCEH
jgi:hypothetical protein